MKKTRLRSWLAWTPLFICVAIICIFAVVGLFAVVYFIASVIEAAMGWWLVIPIIVIGELVYLTWATKYIKRNHKKHSS